MSSVQEAARLLAGIPGWQGRAAELSPLAGAGQRRSFLVTAGDERCVLRLAGRAASGRGMAGELTVHARAAKAGIAPRIRHADPARGLLLTDYVAGTAWTEADLEDPGSLAELAVLLRRLHALPPCGIPYDARAAAEAYLAALRAAGPVPALAGTCRRIIVEHAPCARPACCHNDLVAQNVVRGTALQLIDFEYAGDNEPLFDLAGLAGWHELDDARAGWLLDAWADGAGRALRARFAAERRRFDAIQWLWLAARACDQPQPADAARLERVAARLAG